MSFSIIEDSIPVQPPVGGISYTASGNIYKGQAVYLANDNTVKAPTDNVQKLYGIAGYSKTEGEKVLVYPVGNIVRCKISSSSTLSAGTLVGCIAGGFISNEATYNSGAIIIKSPSTNYDDGEVLILGHSYSL